MIIACGEISAMIRVQYRVNITDFSAIHSIRFSKCNTK